MQYRSDNADQGGPVGIEELPLQPAAYGNGGTVCEMK